MKLKFPLIFIAFCSIKCLSQNIHDTVSVFNSSTFIAPELMIGQLSEPNTDFPEVKVQKTLYLTFGKYQHDSTQQWAYRLNYPKTGFSLGFSDYGNSEQVGRSYSLLPYTEFGILGSKKLNALFGLGASYHDVQYDIKENPNNKAISTKFSWAFRGSLTYDFWQINQSKLRLSLNYLHHSNGHVRLPNQGMNSFLFGISYETGIFRNKDLTNLIDAMPTFSGSTYNYLSFRFGLGQNVLSQVFNEQKAVYTAAFDYGKVINNTYKFGIGAYYRFYEHYYEFIKNEEELVVERYPQFLENPYGYSTNFGIFGTGELLLNHIGIEFQLGLNIYKPAYQMDWILNQGYVFVAYDDDNEPYIAVVYGELDWYYEIKRTVSSRLGLKYYVFGTDKKPTHNLYIGAHINANLGQADFNELSFGYVYSFNFKNKS